MLWRCRCGSICDAEAYTLSLDLKVEAYPFLVVLSCQQSDRVAQVIDKLQGYPFPMGGGSSNSSSGSGSSSGDDDVSELAVCEVFNLVSPLSLVSCVSQSASQ